MIDQQPRHLRYPMALNADGSFATVIQDSDEDIKRSAGLLCDVRPGQLPWARKVGTPSAIASRDPDEAAAAIEAALAEHEPRAPLRVTLIDTPERVRTTRLRLDEGI